MQLRKGIEEYNALFEALNWGDLCGHLKIPCGGVLEILSVICGVFVLLLWFAFVNFNMLELSFQLISFLSWFSQKKKKINLSFLNYFYSNSSIFSPLLVKECYNLYRYTSLSWNDKIWIFNIFIWNTKIKIF